ncbi:membrane protein YczE [Isoptericola aurantiacus]|uniref:membrane protein YczE n=1 Tax=Isoptericola aurantiacus TaxID=3377839 RepID=UPI00383A398B
MATSFAPSAAPTVAPGSPGPAAGRRILSPWRRAVQLVLGLLAYTGSMAMLLHAGQGAMPWDVLSQGIVRTTGWSFGTTVALTSVVVLAAWVPLRQRPGIGTVANVVIIAVAIGPALALTERVAPSPGPVTGAALAVGGIVLNGVATAAYVGVRLGPGPRDGLLTGLVARTAWSVRAVKTGIEVAVVAAGWLLGGTLGWATVAYALGVGVVVQAAARRRWLVPDGLGARVPVRVPPAVAPPERTEREDRTRRRAREIARALDSFGGPGRTG